MVVKDGEREVVLHTILLPSYPALRTVELKKVLQTSDDTRAFRARAYDRGGTLRDGLLLMRAAAAKGVGGGRVVDIGLWGGREVYVAYRGRL